MLYATVCFPRIFAPPRNGDADDLPKTNDSGVFAQRWKSDDARTLRNQMGLTSLVVSEKDFWPDLPQVVDQNNIVRRGTPLDFKKSDDLLKSLLNSH